MNEIFKPKNVIMYNKNGNNRILIIKTQIGKGAMGHIYDGVYIDDLNNPKRVAIKHITFQLNNSDNEDAFKNEISIFEQLAQYENPMSVKFYDYVFNENVEGYIIMEHIQNSITIYELVELYKNNNTKPTSYVILTITINLLKAIQAIHNSAVIHKDISPKNVMVNANDMSVKLIDYELSCKIINDRCKIIRQATTVQYASAEYLRALQNGETEIDSQMGKNLDLYGVASIFYLLMHLKNPKNDIDVSDVNKFIKEMENMNMPCEYVNTDMSFIDMKKMCDIVTSMVDKNSVKRMELNKVLEELNAIYVTLDKNVNIPHTAHITDISLEEQAVTLELSGGNRNVIKLDKNNMDVLRKIMTKN